MRKRRRSRRHLGQQPPSPLFSSHYASRRRSARRPRAALALIALLIALGAVAVVASATGTGSTSSGDRSDPRHVGAHHRRSRPSVPSAQDRLAQADQGAIDRVLSYTPFLTAGTPQRRVIALSFDDGPGPYTERIVRVLARMHAAATFFIVGQELNYFSAGLRDELRHGFSIGDHTENHLWLSRLSQADQYRQIHDAAVRMRRAGAPSARLFRPPYGVYDSSTVAILGRLRMLMVLWSVDPGDWRRPGTEAIVQRVLAAARPGAVVEMHDGGGDRSETAAALPAIIFSLRARGYQLVSVPELVRLDPPPRGQQLPHLSAA